MKPVTTELLLKGKDSNFVKILEKSVENTTLLHENIGKSNKSFSLFNKTTDVTGKTLKVLSKSTIGTGKAFLDLSDNVAAFGKGTVSNSEKIINLNEAVTETTSGLSGFGLKLLGLNKPLSNMNSFLDGPAGHLMDIADASNATERAFIILDKAEKPLIKGLDVLGKGLKKTSFFFDDLGDNALKSSTTLLNVSSVAVDAISNSFDSLEKHFKGQGFLGRFISKQFDAMGEGLDVVKEKTDAFSDSLSPKNFKNADLLGNKLANSFEKTAKMADKLSLGVRAADVVGDIYTTGLAGAEAVKDAVGPIQTTLTMLVPTMFKLGTSVDGLSDGLAKAGNTTNSVNKILKSSFLRTVSQVTLRLGKFVAMTQILSKTVTLFAVDLKKTWNGLGQAFTTLQDLGIDTYAAEAALQLGLMGENLLLNAEASEKFGKAAVVAFSRFQDAVADVTTLTAGTKATFEGMEAGTESINAATLKLVRSLNNSVAAGEATTSMYNALSAGIGVAKDGTADLVKTQQFLIASSKLAVSTGTNSAQVTEILAKANGIYGRSNMETAKTAAQLYGIVQEGITTFPQLAGGLGRVLSVAESAKVPIEEVSGSIAGLTKVMTTDDALTGYNSLLASIAGQGAASSKAVAELGIKFDAQTVASKGLLVSLQDLARATNGNQETLKKIIPDMLAFTTAVNLMGVAGKDAAGIMDNITETGENAEEALNDLFDGRQDTIIQRSTNLMNGFNNVLIEFGEKALPILAPGLKVLENTLKFFENLPGPVKAVVGSIVLIQATIGRIIDSGVSVIAFFGKLFITMTLNNLMMKTLTGSINSEIEAMVSLVTVEKDYLGVLQRLVGWGADYSGAIRKITKAKEAQLKVQEQINKTEINSPYLKVGEIPQVDGLVESYDNALSIIQEKIKELEKSGLDKSSPKLFKQSKKELADLETALKKASRLTLSSQRSAVSELNENINKMLVETSTTISEKKTEIQKGVLSIFEVFGDAGEAVKERFEPQIKEILEDTTLTTTQQSVLISEALSAIAEDSPESVKKSLLKIKSNLTDNFNDISIISKNYNELVEDSYIGILNNIEVPNEQKNELLKSFKDTFKGLDQPLEERKTILKQSFKEMFELLPEEAQKATPQMLASLEDFLDSPDIPIRKRRDKFTKDMTSYLSSVDQETQKSLAPLVGYMYKLSETIEVPLDALNVSFESSANKVKKNLTTFKNIVKGTVDAVNSVKIDPEIKKEIGKLSYDIATILGDTTISTEDKVAKINHEFSKLANEKLPVNVQKNLTLLKKVALGSLDDLNRGSKTKLQEWIGQYEEIEGNLPKTKEKLNETLKNIGDGSVLENVNSNFKQISKAVLEQMGSFDVKEKVEGLNNSLEALGKVSIDLSLFENIPEKAKEAIPKLKEAIEKTLEEGLDLDIEGKKTLLSKKVENLMKGANKGVKDSKEEILKETNKILGDLDKELSKSKAGRVFESMLKEARESLGDFTADSLENFKDIWTSLEVDDKTKTTIEESILELTSTFEKAKDLSIPVSEAEATVEENINKINKSIENISNPEARLKAQKSLESLTKLTNREMEATVKVVATANKSVEKLSKAEVKTLKDAKKNAIDLVGSALLGLGVTTNKIENMQDALNEFGLPGKEVVQFSEVLKGLGIQAKQTDRETLKLAQAAEILAVNKDKSTKSVLQEIKAFKENKKAVGVLAAIHKILNASIFSTTVATTSDTVATGANTIAQNANTVAIGKRGSANLFLSKTLNFTKAAFGPLGNLLKLIPTILGKIAAGLSGLLPILAPLAAIVGSLAVVWTTLKIAVLDNIPGIRMITNEYARLGDQVKKTNQEIIKNNKKILENRGALDKLVKEEEEKYVKPAKAYTNNWLSAFENIDVATKVWSIRLFDTLGIYSEKFAQKREKQAIEAANENRLAVTNWLQSGVRKDLLESLNFTVKITDEGSAISELQEKGKLVTETAKKIVKEANDSNRALTSGELTEILEAEKKEVEEYTKFLSENLAARNKEFELENKKKKSDPVILANLRKQITLLEEETSSLEKGNKEFAKYAQTIQTFATTMELNEASKGVNNLYESFNNTLNSKEFRKLPDRLKDVYKELNGITTEVIDISEISMLSPEELSRFTGLDEKTVEEAIKNGETQFEKIVDADGNLLNALQRRTAKAESVSTLSALQLAVDIIDPKITINQDQAQNRILDAIEAYQESVLNEVITPEQGAIKRKVLMQTEFEFNEEDDSAFAQQFQGKTYEDLFTPQVKEEIFERDIEIIKEAGEREIVLKTANLEQIKALEEKGTLSSQAAEMKRIKTLEEISAIELGVKESVLEATIGYKGAESRSVELLEKELTTFIIEEENKRLENSIKLSQEREKVRNREIEGHKNGLKDIEILEAQGVLNRVEAMEANAVLEEKMDNLRLTNKRDHLATLRSQSEGNTEAILEAELDLAATEREIDLKRFNEKKSILEAELALTQQKFALEKALAQNDITQDSNRDTIRQKVVELETKSLQSQLDLTKAISSFEETSLTNKSKLTGDIVVQAEIELELQRNRQEILVKELEAEEANILFQQELVSLGQKREKSALNLQKLEALNAKQTLQLKVEKKDELGLTEDQVALLEAQIEGKDLELGFIKDQTVELAAQEAVQQSINQRELEALELRRQSSIESAAIETELATRNLIIAGYEKEKNEVILRNEIESVGSQARISGLERVNTILQTQTDLITKQSNLVSQMQSSIQAAFNLAASQEVNAFRKRRLEREAAELQLRTLEKQQEMEKISFELQVQQKDLAMERARIENEIAQAKGAADLLVAQANQRIVEADQTKSQLEKEAAAAQTEAARISLEGLQKQNELLLQQQTIETSTRSVERAQFDRDQRGAVLQQEAIVAGTTLRRSDDRQVQRSALAFARQEADELPKLINTFSSNLGSLTKSLGSASTIGQDIAQANSNRRGVSKEKVLQAEVGLNLNLKVEGDTSGLNEEQVTDRISEGANMAFTELFTELRNRNSSSF